TVAASHRDQSSGRRAVRRRSSPATASKPPASSTRLPASGTTGTSAGRPATAGAPIAGAGGMSGGAGGSAGGGSRNGGSSGATEMAAAGAVPPAPGPPAIPSTVAVPVALGDAVTVPVRRGVRSDGGDIPVDG